MNRAEGSSEEALRRVSDFFMKNDNVHDTMARLEKRLRDEEIPHAIIGGMALALHGTGRPTSDVDVLTTREGLQKIHERLVGRGYVPMFPGARKALRDTTTGVQVEFITAGEFPGDGKPKAVSFPDPATASVDRDGYTVLSLPKLVELKLASGLTAEHRRYRDLGDVETIIAYLKPPRELGEQIDASVRDEYYRMWDAAQNAFHPCNE
ncbi:MAG: hypothetical protein QOI24_22 [Acidobacteriota bacterium]|jgi:hypothetical protein|nr:hypothetical protein [Acidobacteriota bacterium]